VLNLDLRLNGKGRRPEQAAAGRRSPRCRATRSDHGTQLAQIQRPTDITVTGQLYLNIVGFVIALAGFSIEQQSGIALSDNDGAASTSAAGGRAPTPS
jgi:hypothetical protein